MHGTYAYIAYRLPPLPWP